MSGRAWRRLSGGTVIAAIGLAQLLLSGYVASNVREVENRAAVNGKLSLIEVELAARKAYDEAHEAKTAPLVAEHQQMAREWPRAMALIEEMHLFLVQRYGMPTSMPKPAEPPGAGLYAAEPWNVPTKPPSEK